MNRPTDTRHLLITDVDGVLVEDAAALQRFCAWFAARHAQFRLAYATGRFYDSVAALITAHGLPAPDAVIGGVGTDVHAYPARREFPTWYESISYRWDAGRVRELLAAEPALELQPPEHQSPYKVSYYCCHAAPEDLNRLRQTLAAAAIDAAIVYSSNCHLDVVPARANKGTAARFLAGIWGFSTEQVIVCGVSGNDLSLFQHGFRGILPANAHADLQSLSGDCVYRSSQSHADGLIDGLEHWLTHGLRRAPAPGKGFA